MNPRRLPVLTVLLLALAWPAIPAVPVATTAAPAGSPTSATTGAYQVEIVIFRANSPPPGEDLSASAEGRGFNRQLDSGVTAPTIYRTLDASQMQLGGVASRLRANGNWHVLAHAGWVQSATDWPKHAGLPLEQLGINVQGLSGSVYVERGQFLHLGFNLRLGENPAWSLSELRKIRFNEKNYFDHPAFGVIAIVSPAARGPG
jgi:peptidoglycan-binding protein CsiV